jgi:hypothetical protein
MSLELSSKCYKRDGHLYLDSIKQNFNDGEDGIGGKKVWLILFWALPSFYLEDRVG